MTSDTDGAWLSIHEAATALGLSVSTIRRRLKDGTLTARRDYSRYGQTWRVQVSSDQWVTTARATEPGQGDRSERGHDTIERGHEPGQSDYAQVQTCLEQLRLIRDLQTQVTQLAGQLGYVQAQYQQASEQLKALTPGSAHETRTDANLTAAGPGAVSGPPRRVWWAFWR